MDQRSCFLTGWLKTTQNKKLPSQTSPHRLRSKHRVPDLRARAAIAIVGVLDSAEVRVADVAVAMSAAASLPRSS